MVAPGQAQFAASVLRGIGAPVTPGNIAGFVGWAKAEGGSNWQRNNPLNTTESSGASSTFNSVGVRGYPNQQAGVSATVRTLRNGNYGGILQAFKANNPNALGGAIGRSPWGTSGSLAAQTIADTLRQGGVRVPKGAGLGPLPSLSAAAPQSTSTTSTGLDQAAFDKAQKAYVAGSFLSQSERSNPYGSDGPNPLLASGLLTTKAPDPADYQKTFTAATAKLQQIAGTPLRNVHPGAQGYVNPIPGAVIGRTDMGVDATLKPGAPIRAIGDSKVIGIAPDWYKGQPYVALRLLNGPQAGKVYYVAEQIAPSVKAGQTVRAGQPIGTFASSGTGIEIGWGSPTPGRTLAQATTGYTEGQVTPAGGSFRSFLGGLK